MTGTTTPAAEGDGAVADAVTVVAAVVLEDNRSSPCDGFYMRVVGPIRTVEEPWRKEFE